jgi:OOP family OmpA-OmpF porin
MRSLLVLLLLISSFFSIAQLPKIENGKLVLDKQVIFKSGSDELTDEGKEALLQVKEFMTQKDYISTLRIEGHSDNSNTESVNQSLTEKRALSVCKWLVANGIDCKRLIAVGFGSTKPIAPNDDPINKAQNRRIDFIPAAMRGKAMGGMPLDGGGVVAGDPCN